MMICSETKYLQKGDFYLRHSVHPPPPHEITAQSHRFRIQLQVEWTGICLFVRLPPILWHFCCGEGAILSPLLSNPVRRLAAVTSKEKRKWCYGLPFHFFLFVVLFAWDRLWKCSWACSLTHKPPASIFWGLKWQTCISACTMWWFTG